MSMVSVNLEEALQRFGLNSFRPGQMDVISQIIAGHDCLCVMPTGGGKSLCFQIPSVVRQGLTIVVSPLIALMKDQVDGLLKRGISATLINSSLSGSEQTQRLQQMAEGKFSLVYVAPERLRNPRFLDAIRATPIQLLAIDEAHCISEWGHDFRPDYARIGQFREWLGGVQTVALTATATPRVRQDILQILQLKSPKQFIAGFARNNLHFGVIPCHSDRDKEEEIVRFLKTKPGYGIIYAATRKKCEDLVEKLGQELKISLGAYHAGLTIEQRKYIQEKFMKGDLQAIVATNAFGMGIDKADLRYVIHYNMPGSLEAYYQEAGRAGRDGKASQCILLFSYQDRYIQEFFIDNGYPPASMVQSIYEYLLQIPDDPIEMTQQEIRENLDLSLSSEAVGTALQWISRTGVLERLEAGAGLAMVRISSNLPTLVDLLPKTSERRRKVLRVLERAVGDRRYETVYVHPRWLMDQTMMDRSDLNDVLRELCKLDAVEYVPPFRGRAVHFRRRDVRFEDLRIDFEAFERMKEAEYEKLEQVIAFAESKRCRQLSVLQYFGDPSAASCGLCDRCLHRVGWFALAAEGMVVQKGVSQDGPQVDEGLPTECQAILRRILQAASKTNGRLGKILFAQYLAGSENAKLQRLRLHLLPDFSLLSPLTQSEIGSLLDRLLAAGLLEQHEVNRHRPTLSVSQVGMQVASGAQPFPNGFSLPVGLQRRLVAVASERVVAGFGKSPSVSSLSKPPSAVSSPPMPPAAHEKMQDGLTGRAAYGETDNGTRIDSPHVDAAASFAMRDASKTSDTEPSPSSLDGTLEDWHWTWRLAGQGFALFECAAIRRKTMDAILRDLESAVRAGRPFSILDLLDRDAGLAAQKIMDDMLEKSGEQMSAGTAFDSHPLIRRYPSMAGLLRAIAEKTVERSLSRPST